MGTLCVIYNSAFFHRKCNRVLILKLKSKYLYIAGGIILLVFAIVFYVYDPSTSIFFPKCPFMMLTGLPCAGCGSQRAIHSLLHLRISDALHYNVLVVILLPVLAVLMTASFLREKHPGFYNLTHNKYVANTLLVVVLLWWVLRIIFHWYV